MDFTEGFIPVTLQEYCDEFKHGQKDGVEPKALTEQIEAIAKELYAAAERGSVRILTDYDADGITSAYIMRMALLGINPDLDIQVFCNDRRGSYGVPKFVEDDGKSDVIIMDTGCAEMPYIHEKYGDRAIVIDHHLFQDSESRQEFRSNPKLLNPKTVPVREGVFPDYCTAGLAFRCYEELDKLAQKEGNKTLSEEINFNTASVMCAIGSVADVTDVNDPNSRNRQNILQGMKKIDEADDGQSRFDGAPSKQNIQLSIGALLIACGFSRYDCTAHDLGFNSAFINAGGRMSPLIDRNGAQVLFDILTMPTDTPRQFKKVCDALEDFGKLNEQRKEMTAAATSSPYYNALVESHSVSGKERESAVVLYFGDEKKGKDFTGTLPFHTICGLIAGKLQEATGKASIALTYVADGDYYTGSGRNPAGNLSMVTMLERVNERLAENGCEQMSFGGHANACGISRLPAASLDDFCSLIDDYGSMVINHENTKSTEPVKVLTLQPSELGKGKRAAETMALLQSLEPIGEGNKLPLVLVEGVYSNPDDQRAILKDNPNWRVLKIKCETPERAKQITVTDFGFSSANYMPDENGNVQILCELSTRNGEPRLTVTGDKTFLIERAALLQHEQQMQAGGKKSASDRVLT